MRPGMSDPKSTNKPSTASPSDTQESPARAKERELFARMAKVKQYPMAAENPEPSTPTQPKP